MLATAFKAVACKCVLDIQLPVAPCAACDVSSLSVVVVVHEHYALDATTLEALRAAAAFLGCCSA